MKKKHIILIGIVILIVVAIWVYSSGGGNGDDKEIFTVEKQDVTEIISEVGKVIPVKEVDLTFPVSGVVSQVAIEEGQAVTAGQVLARLDSTKIQADLVSAQASVNEAQARLEKVRAGATTEDVKVSRTTVKNAEASLENLKVTASSKIASAQSSASSAEITLQNAQQTYEDQERSNSEVLKDAYEDALDSLRDSNTKADTALKKINYIQELYFYRYDQDGLYVNGEEGRLNEKFDTLEASVGELESTDFEGIDAALTDSAPFLSKLADLLTFMRDKMETDAGIASTVTDNGYIDTQRTSIDTAISGITSAVQNIASTKLNNEIALNVDKAALDAAETALATAQSTYAATESDWKSNVADAEGTLQLAKDQLALKIAPSRQEDIDIAQAQLEQAVSYVNLIQKNLADSTMVATSNGFVTNVHTEAGELAAPSSPVISMVAHDRYQIESYISELDIAYIGDTNSVEIDFDAFEADRVFGGKVLRVDPFETLIDGDVYYRVVVGFTDYDPAIRLGMTADIRIKTNEKKDVLVVPARYIGEEGGKKLVKVLKEGEIPKGEENFDRAEVTTGLKGLDTTEIMTGLSEGQRVIPYY